MLQEHYQSMEGACEALRALLHSHAQSVTERAIEVEALPERLGDLNEILARFREMEQDVPSRLPCLETDDLLCLPLTPETHIIEECRR